MKSPLKSILFDLDGTLIDSLSFTVDAFNHGITAYGGKRHSSADIIAHFGPGETTILERIVGKENAEVAYLAYRNYAEENIAQVPFHPGTRELLEQLRTRKVPFGLVTGRGWETTEMILAHHGVLEWFDVIICHDHVSSSKPSPEGILLGLTKCAFNPAETAYVGDMTVDVLAAQRAGVRSIAALWDSLCEHEKVLALKPDHPIRTPGELLHLIPA